MRRAPGSPSRSGRPIPTPHAALRTTSVRSGHALPPGPSLCRLWVEALVRHLGAISLRPRGSIYVGMIQWQGGCELSEERDSASREIQTCAGCWGGWFRGGAPTPNGCGPMWRERWAGSIKQQTVECPSFRMAPFACGPFEVLGLDGTECSQMSTPRGARRPLALLLSSHQDEPATPNRTLPLTLAQARSRHVGSTDPHLDPSP